MAVLCLRFCARAPSSCGKRGPPFIAVCGPLTIAASRCGAQAPDAQAQQLWLTGLVAPWHMGSSQTRSRTRVPCIGRQTLNHCATREAPKYSFWCYCKWNCSPNFFFRLFIINVQKCKWCVYADFIFCKQTLLSWFISSNRFFGKYLAFSTSFSIVSLSA